MAVADEDKDIESSKKSKKKGGMLKIIIIFVGVLLIVGGGAFAYMMLFSGSEEAAPQQDAGGFTEPTAPAAPRGVSAEAGTMYDFPTFIVNLADPAGSRYLRVSVSAEIPPKNVKLQAEMDQKLPKIKDSIITVLSSKTLEEIATPQGKISLKQELLRRINSTLASGRLTDVYITEFVVQ